MPSPALPRGEDTDDAAGSAGRLRCRRRPRRRGSSSRDVAIRWRASSSASGGAIVMAGSAGAARSRRGRPVCARCALLLWGPHTGRKSHHRHAPSRRRGEEPCLHGTVDDIQRLHAQPPLSASAGSPFREAPAVVQYDSLPFADGLVRHPLDPPWIEHRCSTAPPPITRFASTGSSPFCDRPRSCGS